MTDHRFPEDAGTGAYSSGSGDKNDGASLAQVYDAIGRTDYAKGLSFDVDYTVPEVTISMEKAVVSDDSATATQTGESRSGVAYVQEMDPRTRSLSDGTTNYVYLDLDLSTEDGASYHIDTDQTPPASPYLYLGWIDTAAEEYKLVNAKPSQEFESVRTEQLSNEILYVGDRDPQTVFDAAGPNTTIIGDPTIQHTVSAPVTSSANGLTVRGLNLFLADGTNDDTLQLTGDNPTVEYCVIDGNKANNTNGSLAGSALRLDGTNPTVWNNRIRNGARHNIYINGNGNSIENVRVVGNRSEDAQRSCLSVEGPDVTGAAVTHNFCSGSLDTTGIEIQDSSSGVFVGFNRCWDNNTGGIQCTDHGNDPVHDLTVAGNRCWNNEHGITINNTTSTASENFLIYGNQTVGGTGTGIRVLAQNDNLDYWTVALNISRDNDTSQFYNGSGAANYEAGLNLGFTVA
jgi:hypothetical protein